jgi:hypothetical protein
MPSLKPKTYYSEAYKPHCYGLRGISGINNKTVKTRP